jgi:hypothetical protein
MKICIINDQHFGARKNSKLFHDYFQLFYENIFFPTLEQLGITTIIDMGDTFDNRKGIDFLALSWAKENYYDKLHKMNIKVHTIVGNHTAYFKNTNKINSVDLLLREYDNVAIYSNPTEINIDGLDIFLIPWINSENEIDTYNEIRNTKSKMAMGHLELNGFMAHKGHVMENAREPDPFLKFDKVFSGHYHTRSDNGKIYYLGNPYEIYFNDVNEVKGFTIFDTKTLEHEHVNNPYKLHYQLYYDEDTARVPTDLENKIVRVVVKNKKSVRKFEKYIDKINFQCPYELKIIENIELPNVENMENIQNEDTMSILHSYVEDVDVELDKSKVKNIINDLYKLAMDSV